MSVTLSNLTATFFYLNELQKLSMVTPSIARPYPSRPISEERWIAHECSRKIQQVRINKIQAEIAAMNTNNISICRKTLLNKKHKFRKKIEFLKRKYVPEPAKNSRHNISAQNVINNGLRKKKRKRNSRERYSRRKYRKKLNDFIDNPESRTVVNLSSTNILLEDLFALEVGHGFILSPGNKHDEEEQLILEGFRFIDRIGKAESQFSNQNNSNNRQHNENNPSPQVEIPLSQADSLIPDNNSRGNFTKNSSIPQVLQSYQPKEVNLSFTATKLIKKEFEEVNTIVINSMKNKKTRTFNLSKATRNSINKLRLLVRNKVIDIRKVDKGELILIIDYNQRILTEELNISHIAVLSEPQCSNWQENKDFSEFKLKQLYAEKFITKEELASVTGLLAGGVNGKLRNNDKSIKYTRTINNIELFAKQTTPYVYPLYKAHKLSKAELFMIPPEEVHTAIPSRLVVGMASCQLSRIQIWLEHLLTPLSKLYGHFEYIKDSTDFLVHLENVKEKAVNEQWDWNNIVLFSVDIKALYPSVKFEYLELALRHCFDKYTNWTDTIKNILIDIIIYTLKNQQIYWKDRYYTLNQGITTGGKHSVPLANILLTFISRYTFESDSQFRQKFMEIIMLWKRFIDDCFGILKGTINDFLIWFNTLQEVFFRYGLELTCDTDSHEIKNGVFIEKDNKVLTFLDMDIFKADGTIHSKEHRKETSVNSYIPVNSAHPRHTFAGIVKSQLYRIRRLCSRNCDFTESIESLKVRCIRSGYNISMVQEILSQSNSLERRLSKMVIIPENPKISIRLVTLAGTSYQKEFIKFAKQMNSYLLSSPFKIEIVRSTAPTIGQLLFNNNNKSSIVQQCNMNNCVVCPIGIQNKSGVVKSSVTNIEYKVDKDLTCNEGGIYIVSAICSGQYTGKTIHFGNRNVYHFQTNTTAISDHQRHCNICNGPESYSVTFVEKYLNRGKYSLSEREMLWNHRIKGIINAQKTLKS